MILATCEACRRPDDIGLCPCIGHPRYRELARLDREALARDTRHDAYWLRWLATHSAAGPLAREAGPVRPSFEPWQPGDGYSLVVTRPEVPRGGVGKVTVVIPTAWRPHVVAEAVWSALAQTRRPDRLVIVVNGPADHGAYDAALGRFAGIDGFEVLRCDQAGIPEALNAALPSVDTEYMAVLDDDDLWEPEFLARMTAALDADPAAGMAFCRIRETAEAVEFVQTVPPEPPDLRAMFERNWVIFPAGLFRVGYILPDGFDPSTGGCCDWDVWLRCWVGSGRAVEVPETLAVHRWHQDNTSGGSDARMAGWDAYRRDKACRGAYGPTPKPRFASLADAIAHRERPGGT